MDTRVERALDGELDREHLSRAEAAALASEEALIADVLSCIPEDPMPDLSKAVLSGIDMLEPRPETAPARVRDPVRSAFAWFWRPVPLTVRPAYAFAAIVILAAGTTWQARIPTPPQPTTPMIAATQSAPQVFIQFRLDAPDAEQVSLAGDFTGWQPEYEMIRSGPGMWTIVVPLKPGVHEYAFIVDGERWTADPFAPAVQDGFGGVNSRVAVIAPDSRSL